jgi:flagellar basal-body rod modification protein FlgD
MQTNNVTSTTSSTSGTQATASKDLGKNEFLKLLLAQLANQDPTKPVDNQAFIAQLAQFSSLEQLQALGKKLDMLTIAQASSTQLQVTGLVGRQVTFKTDTLHLDGKPVTAQGNLSSSADSVVAVVTDASGRVVRTMPLGARDAGAFDLSWDGRDDSGTTLPAGDYHVAIHASRSDGATVQSELRGRGTVDAVVFDSATPVLIVGTQRISLSDVSEVAEPPVPAP